jgi:hypothetical protein
MFAEAQSRRLTRTIIATRSIRLSEVIIGKLLQFSFGPDAYCIFTRFGALEDLRDLGSPSPDAADGRDRMIAVPMTRKTPAAAATAAGGFLCVAFAAKRKGDDDYGVDDGVRTNTPSPDAPVTLDDGVPNAPR